MDRLGSSSIWSFVDGETKIQKVSNSQVRRDAGVRIDSYLGLAARVAELQFRNRDYVLLFRGQPSDHRSIMGLTTLKPSIFRPEPGQKSLGLSKLGLRYETLEQAELRLIEKFQNLKRLGRTRVERQRLLRWAILQHYEVCPTPLLDVSQSLRIGASFASEGNSREAFLYVLAVPNISGAVTASAEAGIQMVRLASVCPPSAIRPHIQEGYLLGEYPDFWTVDQSKYYKPSQIDFGLRLLAKFRFAPAAFWNDDEFPRVLPAALYPKGKDWLENAVVEIKGSLGS